MRSFTWKLVLVSNILLVIVNWEKLRWLRIKIQASRIIKKNREKSASESTSESACESLRLTPKKEKKVAKSKERNLETKGSFYQCNRNIYRNPKKTDSSFT